VYCRLPAAWRVFSFESAEVSSAHAAEGRTSSTKGRSSAADNYAGRRRAGERKCMHVIIPEAPAAASKGRASTRNPLAENVQLKCEGRASIKIYNAAAVLNARE